MSLMSNVKKAEGVSSVEEDRIGGDYSLPTGLQELVIEAAYLQQSKSSKALSLNLKLKNRENKSFTETIWFTNKAQETFYVRDNEQNNIPGYNQVNGLAFIVTGVNDFLELATEEKQIMLWDAETRKEKATTVEMVMPLVNQKIIGGVQHIYENTRKEVNNQWVADTNYSRQFNALDKIFQVGTNKTASELINGKEALFIEKWAKENTDTIDKTVGGIGFKKKPRDVPAAGAAPSTPSAPAEASADPLF